MKISGVFLCLAIDLLSPLIAYAECGLPTSERLQVARVSDGDTLRLQDGRLVRVLGINAPEITHGKKAGQPLGRESRKVAQAFIDAANGTVRLGFERQSKDHYGRLLAHVYDIRGRSLAVAQLRAGMAMQIAVPPNIAQAQCLAGAEYEARKAAKGVWRNSYWLPLPAKFMRSDEVGFRLVRGRITKVAINSAVWLELEGKLVVRVAKKDWPAFAKSKSAWMALKGRDLEVRGWISPQKSKLKPGPSAPQFKPLVLQLRSPSSMRLSAQ